MILLAIERKVVKEVIGIKTNYLAFIPISLIFVFNELDTE